jgi:outer membrane protein assembly factor BamB
MKGFLRSKLLLSLAALVMLAAAVAIPLSRNIIHSHAAPSTVGPEPAWALPFPTGTSVSIGPKGIHGDNFRSIVDDRTHTVYRFANPTDPDSLDLVLEPEQTGTSSVATTPLASGTVLAVWAKCHVVLIDYGNGWWSIYLHLANISVSSGDSVTVNTKIGTPTTNVQSNTTCGNEQSSAEHVHFAFLNGSGRNGSYVPMLGRTLCGHSVVEQNNDPTDIILQGLTQTKDQVFTVPQCTSSSGQTIYFGSDDSYVYALNGTNHSLRWRYLTGGHIDSSPAVVNGVVYIGSQDSYVYALKATDGSLLWRYQTGNFILSTPTVVNGIVYIGSGDSYVYALNASNGAFLWRYQTGSYVYSSPAVVNGVVYIGSNDFYLYALNASNGSLLWRYQTGGYIRSSPAVANGVVYVDSFDTYLYALNATDGSLLWRSHSGGDSRIAPAIVNGVVYSSGDGGDGGAHAFNATNGTLLWHQQQINVISEPTVASGVVYIGGNSELYALNATDGSLLWSYQPGNNVFSSPVVAP